MEVHHHPHVAKKSFKEYLLEFLMIFLAVTLGFFAESLREHFVEKHREEEYMKEVFFNLIHDVNTCKGVIVEDRKYAKGIDSLREGLTKAIGGKIFSNQLYYYEKLYLGQTNYAYFNTSAFTELKNSGSLRLVNNQAIVANMNDFYERRMLIVITWHNRLEIQRTGLHNTVNNFFSWEGFDDLLIAAEQRKADTTKGVTGLIQYDFNSILSKKPELKLLNTKPADLKKLYNEIFQWEYQLKNYTSRLKYLQESGETLIEKIRKEYGFINE